MVCWEIDTLAMTWGCIAKGEKIEKGEKSAWLAVAKPIAAAAASMARVFMVVFPGSFGRSRRGFSRSVFELVARVVRCPMMYVRERPAAVKRITAGGWGGGARKYSGNGKG